MFWFRSGSCFIQTKQGSGLVSFQLLPYAGCLVACVKAVDRLNNQVSKSHTEKKPHLSTVSQERPRTQQRLNQFSYLQDSRHTGGTVRGSSDQFRGLKRGSDFTPVILAPHTNARFNQGQKCHKSQQEFKLKLRNLIFASFLKHNLCFRFSAFMEWDLQKYQDATSVHFLNDLISIFCK